MKKTIPALILGSILISACQSTPEIQTGPDAEVIDGNLHRVDHARVDMAYVDPDADFAKYNSVLIEPLGVDNVEIVQPSGYDRRPGKHDWELTDEDKQSLRAAFNKVMTEELSGDGGYPLASGTGDDVLAIVAKLTRIAPSAPKDDFDSRAVGRSTVYSEGSGDISVAIAFADSQTGEVLALTKDRRAGSTTWGINNSVTNRSEVQRTFRSWAKLIRSQLDRVHGRD